ncbi:MAG: hypothetical protein LBJ13_04245 [Puniceicoccales bacterium]|jgi:hypothetical protein|nr:hypothetical protein [Puniceicoccales bacterium]
MADSLITYNYNVSESKLRELIRQHETFCVQARSKEEVFNLCSNIDEYITQEGLRARVYTKGRVVAGLLGSVVGPAVLAGIVAHNLWTYNPDYEIARNIITNTVDVVYKKLSPSG